MNRRKPFRGQDYLLAANRLALSAFAVLLLAFVLERTLAFVLEETLALVLEETLAQRFPGTAFGLVGNKALELTQSRKAPKAY